MDGLMGRRFILASASPARLKLLRASGFDPEVIVSGVDEDDVTGDVASQVVTLAQRKAVAVADRPEAADALVLGCDSMLEFRGRPQGKPADADQAVAWWKEMRGNSGTLFTGHCVVDTATGRRVTGTAATSVRFGAPSDEEIAAYVATGEPLRVAGAFTIDGRGAPFIAAIEGDHGTVIGVSLPVLRTMLGDIGVEVTSLWC